MERLTTPQNSWLRRKTTWLRRKTAEVIHEHTDFTADDVTKSMKPLAVIAGGVSTYLNTHEEIMPSKYRRGINALLVLVAMLPDAIDGPLSDIEREERLSQLPDPEKVRYSEGEIEQSVKGGRLDFCEDRKEEWIFTYFRGLTAFFRHDSAGYMAARRAAKTNPDSSQARAMAEEQGIFVKEATTGLGFLGNRVGRGLAAIVAVAFPEAQAVIDEAVAFSNQESYSNRLEELKSGKNNAVDVALLQGKERFDIEVALRLAPLKIEDARVSKTMAVISFLPTDLLMLRRLYKVLKSHGLC